MKRRLSSHYIIPILVLILSGVAISYGVWRGIMDGTIGDSMSGQHYFVSPYYDGVTSRIVEHDSDQAKSFMEYPETPNKTINSYIANVIDTTYHKQFTDLQTALKGTKGKLDESISYQVQYANDKYISIVISIDIFAGDERQLSATEFWTFDRKSGKTVTILELLGGSTDGRERLLITLRNTVKGELKKYGQDISDAELVEAINADTITNFSVLSKQELVFPFGQADTTDTAKNTEVTARIPIDTLQLFMQNDIARSLFDVTSMSQTSAKPVPTSSENTSVPTSPCMTGKKCIALTFDDGPGPYTSRLLDTLDTYNAKATFFVLGQQVNRHESIIKRMKSAQHEIGNHSWDHAQMTKLSASSIKDEITRTDDAIKAITGIRPTFVRPPYGAFNKTVIESLEASHHPAALWSIDTRDWADRNATIVCNRATTGARSGGIIIMHDVHATTVDAVPCILKKLAADGYTFVTVSDLVPSPVAGNVYYRTP